MNTPYAGKQRRNSLWEEKATLLKIQSEAAGQYLIDLHAPHCARHALPGQFIQLACSVGPVLRRPFSIMATQPETGTLRILFKVVGQGTAQLAQQPEGQRLSMTGPIGQPFTPHPDRPHPLLMGGGVGIPPMLFLAHWLHQQHPTYQPTVLLGSEVPFPLPTMTSELPYHGVDRGCRQGLSELEHIGISSRLCSQQGYPGCFQGWITDLAEAHLNAIDPADHARIALYACGPGPMLQAVKALAERWQLPCQLSLEEHMACGVGGCAGCVVPVDTQQGTAMQRVCVDGPVFDARQVFNQTEAT